MNKIYVIAWRCGHCPGLHFPMFRENANSTLITARKDKAEKVAAFLDTHSDGQTHVVIECMIDYEPSERHFYAILCKLIEDACPVTAGLYTIAEYEALKAEASQGHISPKLH